MADFRLKNVGANRQSGFTLIEMMVVIGIIAVLSAIVIGGWSALRESNKVEAAAESMRSALVAARIQAISTGRAQQVTVNFAANGAAPADSFASTVSGGVYSSATKRVEGGEYIASSGVDWVNAAGGLGACTVSQSGQTFKTIVFGSRGSASALSSGGGVSRTWIVQDKQGANRFCFTVNTVTGRVSLQRL